jgi:hypothetical protein
VSAAAEAPAIGTRTRDAFLQLAAAAERYADGCLPCRGEGRIPEYFEVFRMIAGERLQKALRGRATRWHTCEACGPLRRAIEIAMASL